ncbi:MAG: winged helix-turn-helix domain-containing protein [bacterium]
MQETIGTAAGKIWKFLQENGEVTVLKLKTNLKLSNSLVCMGIGWLAREDKICIKNSKKDNKVSLKGIVK